MATKNPGRTQGNSPSGFGRETEERGKETVEKAKGQAKTILYGRKEEASEKLGGLSSALKETAQRMHREQRGDTVADYLEKAADRIEQLTDYINNRDVDQLIKNFEERAKKRPMIFLAGSFGAGFLLARFIKSRPAEAY